MPEKKSLFEEVDKEKIITKLEKGLGLWEKEAQYVVENPQIKQALVDTHFKIGNIKLFLKNGIYHSLNLGENGYIDGAEIFLQGTKNANQEYYDRKSHPTIEKLNIEGGKKVFLNFTNQINSRASINKTSGNVSVKNAAFVYTDKTDGNVHIQNTKKDASTYRTNGNISVQKTGEDTIIEDTNGNISVDKTGGKTYIDSATGTINIAQSPEKKIIKNTTGTIFIDDGNIENEKNKGYIYINGKKQIRLMFQEYFRKIAGMF